jgi:hypothetical protein
MNAAESCFVVRWLSFDVASYAVQRMKRKLHRSRDGRRQVFGNAVLRKKLRNCTQGVGRTFHNVVADRAVHVDIKQASTEPVLSVALREEMWTIVPQSSVINGWSMMAFAVMRCFALRIVAMYRTYNHLICQ